MDGRNHRSKEHASFMPGAQTDGSGGAIIVDIACDDRFSKLSVEGWETVAQIRRKALAEMKILTASPDAYLVIGAGRRRIDAGRTIDELQAEGERLAFRFLRPPVFGKHVEKN